MAIVTSTQVLFLQVLAKAKERGLSAKQIGEKAGVSPSAESLGPVYSESVGNHPDSLYGRAMVRVQKYAGEDPRFIVTKAGLKIAQTHTTRRRLAKDENVPNAKLDKAVLTLRDHKVYGLELWTDEDLKELRAMLGPKARNTPIDELRQRIVNRRKQGAFSAQPQSLPGWYEAYRKSAHFKKTREKMLKLHHGCSLNVEHQEDLDVWHRSFVDCDGESVLNKENPEDLIVLCGACLKRNRKFLTPVPAKAGK